MARWVTVATMRYMNNVNDVRKGRDRVREIWEILIDRAALDKPDIMLLPEQFMSNALMDGAGRVMSGRELAEEIPGEGYIQDFLARKARQYNMYIAAGMGRLDPATGRLFNSGVLFDRAGRVAGVYDKLFPTTGEMEHHEVTPGDAPVVFDADFGRVGIAVCFDLNFPELFEYYRRERVELCCFLSSMHGGTHLPSYARDCRMYIASAVENGSAYIVNPIGGIVAKTFDSVSFIAARINLDCQLYHVTPRSLPEPFPVAVKRKYGDAVRFEHVEGEPWHLVCCDRADMTAADILNEFKVEPIDNLFDRTRALRRARVPDGF